MTAWNSALPIVVAIALSAACSSTSGSVADEGFRGSGGASNGAGGSAGSASSSGPFSDFVAPIVEPSAPANSAELFGDSSSGAQSGGPCLVEPEPGTLYPKNWLRPRFSWIAGGMNLFELRLHVENQTADLVVYTSASSWTMPKAIWDTLQAHSVDVAITISIRGGMLNGSALGEIALGSSGPLRIAPVEAPGSIVFWAVNQAEMSELKGFEVGEEGLVDVLKAEQIPGFETGGRECIGCHSGTPDGKFVSLTWEVNYAEGYNADLASVDPTLGPGSPPAFLGAAAKTALAETTRSLTASSPAHWSPGDHVLITDKNGELAWVDLEATSAGAASGSLGRDGDPNPLAFGPSFSNDGQHVAYMSGTTAFDPSSPWDSWQGPLDIFVLPYNDRAGASGGAKAQPLAGASDPNWTEYYPAYSPDDQWLAFSAVPGADGIYDNPSAEVFVVPATGGQAIRLEANGPAACSGRTSPGVTNSWPKWSPEVREANGRKYYWLVFSSRRATTGLDEPKLYVAPFTVDPDGTVQSYKALYLWNQETIDAWDQWGNHTPAWALFKLPSVPIQ